MITTKSALVVLGFALAGCGGERGETPSALRSGETAVASSGLHYALRALPPPEPYLLMLPVGLAPDGGLTANGDFIGVAEACDDQGACREDLIELSGAGEYHVLATDFFPGGVTRQGDVGGCTLSHDGDLDEFDQAAILHADGRLERLPRLPGELRSCIDRVSDAGTALVLFETAKPDGSVEVSYYVWLDGQAFPANLGAQIAQLNDRGELTGMLSTPYGSALSGYRFDARSQMLTPLPPLPCDSSTFAYAINQGGDVLGYSETIDGIQHIAKWNEANDISVLFTEGNSEISTLARRMAWNESGLVVLSDTDDDHTYVVPAPGVRLDLASLVDPGVDTTFLSVLDVNAHGDLLALDAAEDVELFIRED